VERSSSIATGRLGHRRNAHRARPGRIFIVRAFNFCTAISCGGLAILMARDATGRVRVETIFERRTAHGCDRISRTRTCHRHVRLTIPSR